MRLSVFLSTLLVLVLLTGLARAESRYVTDQLTITLRSGQDSSYRVLQTLSSGSRVEVLSSNESTGYSRLRTDDGTEGYSLTRYLTDVKPAQVRVGELRAELAKLRADSQTDTRQELGQLQSEYQSLKLKYDTLEFENVQLTQRMEAVKDNAANVVSLMNERDEARQRANRLSTELDEVQVRNMELENYSDKKWFIAGAGVLAFGIVVGLVLPRVGGGRRRSGWRSGDLSL